jgi:hypothetical protein
MPPAAGAALRGGVNHDDAQAGQDIEDAVSVSTHGTPPGALSPYGAARENEPVRCPGRALCRRRGETGA